MNRIHLFAVAAAGALLVAGCTGEDSSTGPDTTDGGGTPGSGHRFPTGGDELVVSAGGVMIGGDGRAYRRLAEDDAAVRSIAPPGPPLSYTVTEITPEGMATILGRADELGLLEARDFGADVELHPDQLVNEVLIRTEDVTAQHRLPWIPLDEAYDEDELNRLRRFDQEMAELESLVGDAEIGEPSPYVPERWEIRSGYSERTERPVPWPLDEPPVIDACVSLPTDARTDTASGAYEYSAQTVYAAATFPWTDC